MSRVHPAVLLCLLAGVAPSSAQILSGPSPAGDTVTVTGTGRVELAPERASFTAGVQSVAPTVAAALQENSARVSALVDALRKAGAAERHVRTAGFAIHPRQTHHEGRPPRIEGYEVSNTVTVSDVGPAEVGRLLQAAVEAGANTVSGVSFGVAEERGREAGLQRAFADARAKAEVLARVAGRTLGRALRLVEGPLSGPPVPYAQDALMESRTAAVPIAPGTEELSYTVSAVFELR